jgi:2,4-dienoyl-CoA reductase-like NADH-dependent reductase (Old Yellow Enzyme family)
MALVCRSEGVATLHPRMIDPFAPAKLGPVTLRNRIIKAATFEGATPKRVVTDRLIDFHRSVAAGGVGMATVAYCAISRDGTTDGRQIVLDDDAVPGLRRLTDAIHAEGAAACAQIGHAGPVSNPKGTKHPSLAPSRVFAPIGMRFTRAVTEDDMVRITADYGTGARRLVDGGFDAIEIHMGHNYLLSAFMSPRLNRRRDEYGGSIENRARFPRAVARAVRDAAGPDVAVTAKFNMADGPKRGLQPDGSIEIAKLLEADGAVDALELTGGSSFNDPMYLFRGDAPVDDMAATMPRAMRLGFRLLSRRVMPSYPFEEAYFLPLARRFREALSMPLILLGGITTRTTIERAVNDEGFEFVAMARALLREPDLVKRMAADPRLEATCIHCNRCMPSIYSGTRCVLDHPAPIMSR